MTWTCLTHGPIPPEEVYLLTWDSPHGDERHSTCGSGVDLEGYDPDLTPDAGHPTDTTTRRTP